MITPAMVVIGERGMERGLFTSAGERDVVSPAFTVTCREKVRYPGDRISTVCVPGAIFARVIGVIPMLTESTYTAAPAGLEARESVPASAAMPEGVVGATVTFPAGAAGGTTVIVVRYVFLTEGLETVT